MQTEIPLICNILHDVGVKRALYSEKDMDSFNAEYF